MVRRRPRFHLVAVGVVAVLTTLLFVVLTTGIGDRSRSGAASAAGAGPTSAGPAAPPVTLRPTTSPQPASTTRATTVPSARPPKTTTPAKVGASTPSRSSTPESLTDQKWDMVPLPDLSPYSDAVIKNSADSTHKLRVCRNWSERTCAKSSPRGDLKPGEDSATKFGWKDTDGFDLGDGWVKQHGCFRCVVTVTS